MHWGITDCSVNRLVQVTLRSHLDNTEKDGPLYYVLVNHHQQKETEAVLVQLWSMRQLISKSYSFNPNPEYRRLCAKPVHANYIYFNSHKQATLPNISCTLYLFFLRFTSSLNEVSSTP